MRNWRTGATGRFGAYWSGRCGDSMHGGGGSTPRCARDNCSEQDEVGVRACTSARLAVVRALTLSPLNRELCRDVSMRMLLSVDARLPMELLESQLKTR